MHEYTKKNYFINGMRNQIDEKDNGTLQNAFLFCPFSSYYNM